MATKRKTKDPHGGLTAAGRAEFARKDGSHLKPGVQKPASAMSVSEMKRKGSWAARFYGRSGELPALVDAYGRPTRFALTAAAWGEAVPKTVTAARKIAEKGRRLLERAKRAESTKEGKSMAAKKKTSVKKSAKKAPAKKAPAKKAPAKKRAAKKAASATRAPPWKRSPPKKRATKHLTPAQKSRAKARAKKAGRSYPNLVDNMHEAG